MQSIIISFHNLSTERSFRYTAKYIFTKIFSPQVLFQQFIFFFWHRKPQQKSFSFSMINPIVTRHQCCLPLPGHCVLSKCSGCLWTHFFHLQLLQNLLLPRWMRWQKFRIVNLDNQDNRVSQWYFAAFFLFALSIAFLFFAHWRQNSAHKCALCSVPHL